MNPVRLPFMTPSKTLWLSQQQQSDWRAYLSGVARIDAYLDAALRPYDLCLGEYEILVNLSEADEHAMRMSDLALAVRQSRSRLTHTVTRMEKKGLIERVACPEDRRGVMAVLKEAGLKLLVEAAPAHVRSVREVFVDVVDPDDFAAIGRAMASVAAVRH